MDYGKAFQQTTPEGVHNTGTLDEIPYNHLFREESVMIKMLKEQNNQLNYWEVWYDEDSKEYNIHFGLLGDIGNHQIEAKKKGINVPKYMDQLAKGKLEEGYMYLEDDLLQELMIQYKTEENKIVEEELEKRHFVESLMNECLGWTGNGHCDGGDYGSGTMNIFCYVINSKIAIETIINELTKNDLLDNCTIAISNGEDYISYYPTQGETVGIF